MNLFILSAWRHLLEIRFFGYNACDWGKINEKFPRENATVIILKKKRQICIEKHSEVKIVFFGTKTCFPPRSAFFARHTLVFVRTLLYLEDSVVVVIGIRWNDW